MSLSTGNGTMTMCSRGSIALLALLCALFPLSSAAQDTRATSGGAPGAGLIKLWAAGQPALGYYVRQAPPGDGSPAEPHPRYTEQTGRELAANPLPDFAFLSLEQHYDGESARNIARGLRSGGPGSDMTLLVRIPPISDDGATAARARALELLELGANGVVIPHVLSLAEAHTALSFFEGINVWSPANPTGDVVVMLIVEDPEVFAELEAIADLPAYSSLVCGIGSLTQALGDPAAAEKINLEVLAQSQRVGKADMITVNEASIATRIEQGFLGLLAYGPTANETLRLGRTVLAGSQ